MKTIEPSCGHNDYGLYCAGCVLAFAEERVKEAKAELDAWWGKQSPKAINAVAADIRAEALEEAAKKIESIVGPRGFEIPITYTEISAKSVRDLKSKP